MISKPGLIFLPFTLPQPLASPTPRTSVLLQSLSRATNRARLFFARLMFSTFLLFHFWCPPVGDPHQQHQEEHFYGARPVDWSRHRRWSSVRQNFKCFCNWTPCFIRARPSQFVWNAIGNPGRGVRGRGETILVRMWNPGVGGWLIFEVWQSWRFFPGRTRLVRLSWLEHIPVTHKRRSKEKARLIVPDSRFPTGLKAP